MDIEGKGIMAITCLISHTHTDRLTHTHTDWDRQTDRHTHTHILTGTDRHTHTHILTGTDRQTYTHTHTHWDRQTYTYTHTYSLGQTDRQTDIHTHIHILTGTDRQTDRQTHTYSLGQRGQSDMGMTSSTPHVTSTSRNPGNHSSIRISMLSTTLHNNLEKT